MEYNNLPSMEGVMAKVSVILNSFNQDEFFEEAIKSVLNQNYEDFELIISENGSTDNSKNIMHKYSSNPKVKILDYDKNDVIGKRFNQAIKNSTGKFICFLYSDDFIDKNKLLIQVEEFEKISNEYGVTYSDVEIFNEYSKKKFKRKVIKCDGWSLKYQLENIHIKGHIDMVSPLIKKECLIKHRFLENIFAEGEGILLRIAQDYKFKYIPCSLAYFRDTKFNRGKAIIQNLSFHNETLKILEKNLTNKNLDILNSLNMYRFYFKQNVAWGNVRANGDINETKKILSEIINFKNLKYFNTKTLLILIFKKLPKKIIKVINLFLDRLFNIKTNNIFIKDYGGKTNN